VYHKAGVVLDGLEPPSSGQQLSLFEAATALATTPAELLSDRMPLINTLDSLNQRFGRGTVRLASAVRTCAGAHGRASTSALEGTSEVAISCVYYPTGRSDDRAVVAPSRTSPYSCWRLRDPLAYHQAEHGTRAPALLALGGVSGSSGSWLLATYQVAHQT
jgi:hypothetical protein